MDYYLFASIAGGILLLASLFHHHGGGHDDDSPLQLRTLTYFFAFGGITGLLLEHAAQASAWVTALSAFGVGSAAAAMAHTVVRLASSDKNVPLELTGREATVLVPFAKGSSGRIRVVVNNAAIDLIATCDDADIDAGREVLIVSAKNGEAKVSLVR